MKIAIFTDSFFPYRCGITTAIKNRVRGLMNKGHDVAVFRPSSREIDTRLPEKLEVYDLPFSVSSKRFKNLDIEIPLFLPAYNATKKFDPDIIHVDTEGGVGWQGIICSNLLKKPLVTTPHTFWADEEYVKYFPLPNSDFKKSFVWKYMLLFHARADLVIAPSHLMKNEFKSRGFKEKIEVVPNSIPETELKSEKFIEQKRENYNLKGGINLIFVGRVSHEKSLGKVLKAFKKTTSSFPEANFVVIGEGDAKVKLKKQAERLGVKSQVKFLGSFPNKKIMRENLYRLGDIFVTASKTETFGVTSIEAQIFGLPVVAPAAGGIPEVVNDQEDGLLYSPEIEDEVEKISQLLEELMEDRDKREKMSRKALENSERYKIEKVTQKLEESYQSLIYGS